MLSFGDDLFFASYYYVIVPSRRNRHMSRGWGTSTRPIMRQTIIQSYCEPSLLEESGVRAQE